MPVKKEGDKHWVEMQVLLPGTPEQVWAAIATGAGMAAWFTKAEIEPKVGGKLVFDFGAAGTSSGEVTAWEPNHRVGYVEREWAPGAPEVATEITITSRSGGTCVMRMVHSIVTTSDEWDDQLESFEFGWPSFFEVLRIYLAHFAGQEAGAFMAMVTAKGEHPATWVRLLEVLGLAGVNVGDQRTIAVAPETVKVVVEHVHQDTKIRILALRLEGSAPGIILTGSMGHAEGTSVSVNRYCYGKGAEGRAAALAPAWQSWLEQTFSAGD
jgi:uncharacterized protein YndB with AHSA1/START domain